MCLWEMFASESKQLDISPPYLFENADSPFSIHLHKMEATSKLLINTHFWNIKKNFIFFYCFFFFFFLHMSGDQKSSNGYCGIICTWWCGERMWFRSGVTCRSADIRFQCSAKHILQIIYRAPRDLLYPTPTPNPPSSIFLLAHTHRDTGFHTVLWTYGVRFCLKAFTLAVPSAISAFSSAGCPLSPCGL